MRNNRARTRQIRNHMAATGQPFILAARAVDNEGFSYLRTEWNTSGWARLLPVQAMALELVIGTATVAGQDGDLATLVAAHATITRLSDGVDTVLAWHDRDEVDEECIELARQAQSTFTAAVTALNRPVPITVAGLADLLADLGAYRHTRTATGAHRWRTSENLPDPIDVLPLGAAWIDREDWVRWVSHTAGAAAALVRHLQNHRGHDELDTTLQRLASDAGLPVDVARAGLEGLAYRAGLTVRRQGTSLDRRDLTTVADHARIQVHIDWTSPEFDPDDDDGARIIWQDAPWIIYRHVADDSTISDNAHATVGLLEFRFRKPNGGTFITCLSAMATERGSSVQAAAGSLIELEEAGLLRWRGDDQYAELASRPGQFLQI